MRLSLRKRPGKEHDDVLAAGGGHAADSSDDDDDARYVGTLHAT